jgi:hypothetical protein
MKKNISKIICPYCRKRFQCSKLGQKKYNFHIQERHPEAYGTRVIKKTFIQSLVEELNTEHRKNNLIKEL